MGTPLQVGSLVVRTLSQLYNIPLVGVNHCVGRKSCLSTHLAATDSKISKWVDISPRPITQSSFMSLAETHRSLPIRSSDTVYLVKRSISPLEIVWTALHE